MIRRLLTLSTLLAATVRAASPAAAPAAPATPAPSILWWNNGETLAGEFQEASAASVTWKSPLFEGPLELDRGFLSRVDRSLAATPPSGAFSFRLRDGSQLFGDLISIDDATVKIHSARCGDLTLKRSEVLTLGRLHGENLLARGPIGDVAWDFTARRPDSSDARPTPPPRIPPLVTGPGGALELPYWNRTAYLNVTLPERVDLEFHVRSAKRPDFKLSLATSSKQSIEIETWDEDLVFRSDNHFKAIRKIADAEHDLALRICWDAKVRKCAAYSPAGELLAEWEIPEVPIPAPAATPPNSLVKRGSGVLDLNPTGDLNLQNMGRDLSLQFIRVRTWDGSAPPKIDPAKPRLELSDGRILQGEVSEGGAETIVLHLPGADEKQSFPLDRVDAVVLSAAPAKPSQFKASLSCNDGTFLMGQITGLKDGAATLETSFAEGPLIARLDGLRQLRFRSNDADHGAAEPSMAKLDRLVIQQTTLHGQLTAAGDNQPRWLPVGALRPAIPSKSVQSEFTRSFPPTTNFSRAPALFYTKSGDVLPGKLDSIDRSGVEFESDMVETRKLPVGNLNAVQFDPPVASRLEGFEGAGWRILKGNSDTVKRNAHDLTMQPGTTIGHPFAMQGDAIDFTIKGEGWSTFRMRMFCNGTDGTGAPSLLLFFTGNELYSGLESSDGQFANEVVTNLGGGNFNVHLAVSDREVDLQVNGMSLQTFKIASSTRHGAGLVIEPASAWGNQVNALALTKFSAHLAPGRTWLPEIAADAKAQALTVPRFRKNNPPKQALIAANGDILRGEIDGTTAKSFGLHSGVEELRVNRDRVQAIVWLGKPLESGEPAASPVSEPKDLDQSIQTYNRYSSATLQQLIDFIQSQTSNLKFKLPAADSQKIQFQFGGQLVRQALDSICGQFHLTWRVDASGTIVLSPLPKPGNEITQRVYWLKPGALTATASIKSILAAKGISFPEGASVSWNPDSSQLVMKNNAASHAKFAALVESDFGGSPGAPTHWLSLTSGARLALIVDKFESDSISGHHPLYGRCKIPFSDVCTIRSAMAEPSPAYRALDNWRLVLAPEPVLPESGGETSPMLGKIPKSFKLKLLGGGDFDLAQQKGKIVVLDFWATWCGPCVKSLPGLIESMSGFTPDQVAFAGLDQGEPPEQVKRFLEIRGWKLNVALDAQQDVARQFGVDGIPHTVVIGRDGKVAWTKSGYDPDDEGGAAKMVKQLLTAPAANDGKAAESAAGQ